MTRLMANPAGAQSNGVSAPEVEIIDTGTELPALVSVPDTSGYGLQIVDRLASRWGIDQVPQLGKNVWFELDVAGPELSPSHPN